MFEEEEKITFKEFKAWLVGLIRGKRGAIPDLQDWKQIKKMMDKVQEAEPIVIKENGASPCYPLYPIQPQPWDNSNPYWNPESMWCSSSDAIGQSYNSMATTPGNTNMLPITEKTYNLGDMDDGGESEKPEKPITTSIKPSVKVLVTDRCNSYSDAMTNVNVEDMLEIINDWIE